jgi:hypothetical protein
VSLAAGVYALASALACGSSTPAPAAPKSGAAQACEGQRTQLHAFVAADTNPGARVEVRPDLPTALLGGVIGPGHALEITADAVSLDGVALPGQSEAERRNELQRHLERAHAARALQPGAAEAGQHTAPALYVALGAQTDLRSVRLWLNAIPAEFRVYLVFRTPTEPVSGADGSVAILEQLHTESEPAARKTIAEAGYTRWARCPALLGAVTGIPAGTPSERWPALQTAVLQHLPSCECDQIDAVPLRDLLLAEQRAGAASLGAVPADFLRDERCGAALGLQPLQQVLKYIEAFDQRHSGGYSEDALAFEDVMTNELLLPHVCPALPGETLAALQRERRTFFWKVPGSAHCQAWQFEPLQPGSPMGTWRRLADSGEEPLALHYWQGAEEIRLYGPVPGDGSKPTDDRAWACSQDFKMKGVDAASIELETGRWFFEPSACEHAEQQDAEFPGCVASLAGAPAQPVASVKRRQ